jgi:O-antigen/teichoic acid export membrane protein
MNLGQSIRSGVKWLFLGNLGSRFLEFAFGVALARLLVPADFGIIVTISVFTGFASMMMSGGMGQSLIRAKEADPDDFDAVFTMQLSMGVAIYLLFFVAAPWIAGFFENPLYTDLIRVSTVSFLLRPFAFMRTSWLNREMAFKERSMIDIASVLISGVSGSLMAWFGMGVWSLTLSGLLSALGRNILLSLITPLQLRLNFDLATMRKHSSYGFKITVNDFLSYLTSESKSLLLSKLAGPAFLGLFNKAESLSRLPSQLFMSATIQPVFRAMSKVQDDLDQTKYMFYRVITLLMVYTTPLYVGLWWVAEPFIRVVYGEKWMAVAEPLRILVLVGLVRNIQNPCGVLLDAQNRLTQEMVALFIQLTITIGGCLIGLRWGMAGVAWAIVGTYALSTAYYYFLVYRTIHTRLAELVKAVLPGMALNTLLFLVLAVTDHVLGDIRTSSPAVYLMAMVAMGGLGYLCAFLFLPIASISGEVQRWRGKIDAGLQFVLRGRD